VSRFAAALLSLLLPFAAAAQVPSIQASVDVQSVTLADTVTLQVAIEAPQGYESYDPPDLRDFVVLDTGRQTQTQIIMQGGRLESRSTETFTYALQPRRTGTLNIGAARVRASGRTVESRPIGIQVAPGGLGGSPVPPAPPASLAPSPSPPTVDLGGGDDSLFLQVAADRPEVWVGQQVNVTWSLYTQADVLDYRPSKDPTTDAFWSEDLYAPTLRLQFERQVVGGRLYLVAPVLRKALFPLREGDLTVAPMEAEVRTVASRLFATGPVRRQTPELTIHAKPLPVEGRPPGFTPANVGRFAIEAHTDRTQVQAGEPLAVHVIVRGTGNIRALKAPALAGQGFKVYEPRIEDRVEPGDVVSGEKHIDYVLLPSVGGAVTIPALALPYFDPDKGAYAVARTEPITVTVIGNPAAVGSSARDSTPRDNVLAEDIRPIRRQALLRPAPGPSRLELLLPVWLAVPPAGYLSAVGLGLLRARLSRDTPVTRRRRARRQVRLRLRAAEQRLSAGDAAGFFAEVSRAVGESLAERLGRRIEGMARDELGTLLVERAGADLATAIVEEMDGCDFARFAPPAARMGEMQACLDRLPGLLDRISRIS
jgi:oxygen tolerance protein BatD